MIKEYNYYITTNRFSQIAEALDYAVRSYALVIDKQDAETDSLRERARMLCSEHLIKSGLRNKNNSFINIDAEFFEGGELIEENLNKFIKNILKAHGYQKILWEYMGTTSLMTEISKSAMETDGFKYENYLPAVLKEKIAQENKTKINRNFNRLGDDSGFDWSKSYDPNYTVEKKGWFSDYDENGVWTRFSSNTKSEAAAKKKENKINSIKLVKNEHGYMLYDPDKILLNPVLLWYLTQNDEVYGGEESDTVRLLEVIKNKLTENGNAKITEIAVGSNNNKKDSEKLSEQYKSLLGNLAEKRLTIVSSEKANKIAEENTAFEKNLLLEERSLDLQKKIASILKAKPQTTPEEISAALENGKTETALDILEEEDAKLADLSDEEYQSFIERAAELTATKRAEFAKATAVISKNWNEYKTSGKTKTECIELLYKYVKSGKESDFNYELSLRQVLENTAVAEILDDITETKALEQLVKESLPVENQDSALEYIASLPEQPEAAKASVYKALYAAVKNYLTVRMSTGMSIKELFDYAVKSQGGKLPKASFTPPVVGYIGSSGSATAPAKDATGEKRIFFDGKVSALFEELMNKPLPQKEVSLEVLEEAYEKSLSKKNRKTVKLGFKNPDAVKNTGTEATESSAIYDIGDAKTINPLILAVLKMLYISEKESRKKLIELAKVSKSRQDFIRAVSKDFQIEYNFADEAAREVFAEQNRNVPQEVLAEYAEDFEAEAVKLVTDENYVSSKNIQIEPVFRQINQNQVALPAGYRLMKEKTSAGGVLEKITSLPTRLFEEVTLSEKNEISKKAETPEEAILSEEEKQTVKLLIADMNEAEKTELIYAAGEDWNNITPFLIREFLWRKQKGRSVKNLSEEIKVYEKLGQLPQSELEKYLTSSAVNGNENNESPASIQDKSLVPVTKLTPQEKVDFQKKYGIKTEGLSPVIKEYIKSGEWKKNSDVLAEVISGAPSAAIKKEEKKTVKLLLEKLSEAERTEIEKLAASAGTTVNALTPLFIKEYLWRKTNKKDTKNLAAEVSSYEKLSAIPQSQLDKLLTSTAVNGNVKKVSLSAASVPIVKLTAEEKQHFQQTYGLPTEGLSPVVQAYIKSGVWRNKRLTNRSLLSEQHNPETALSRNAIEIPHSKIQTSISKTAPKRDVSFSSNSVSTTKSVADTSPSETISAPLKETLTRLAESRHAKKQQNLEMTKLDRINANYEHDKAILAKSEPLFAKNQFWDVGHAEESGELSSRDKDKSVQDGFNQKVDEILNGGI